jgi:hypothetical protein
MNVKNSPVIAKKEIERKANTEPEGYFFQGMNDIAQKVLRTKNP